MVMIGFVAAAIPHHLMQLARGHNSTAGMLRTGVATSSTSAEAAVIPAVTNTLVPLIPAAVAAGELLVAGFGIKYVYDKVVPGKRQRN